MANNTLRQVLAEPKNRVLIVLVTAVLVILGLYFFASSNTQTQQQAPSSADVAKLNLTLQNKPGLGNTSQQYQDTAYKDNQRRSQQAQQTGGSAVPTLVSDQIVGESTVSTTQSQQQRKQAQIAQEQYEALIKSRQQQQLLAQQQAQTQAQQQAARAALQGQEDRMEKQAKALFALWGAPPQMIQLTGKASATTAPGQPATSGIPGAGGGQQRPEKIIYRAGDIVFAVIDTALNSDEPGPVMARIVDGPLTGAKIIGRFSPASGVNATKLQLTFTLLSMPRLPRSIALNAIAIDPETARTAIATDVDHHYLLRYGSLLASSFLEGMSDAVLASLNQGGIRTNDQGAFVFSTVRSTTRDEVIAGLGKVGKRIGEATDVFDRPPTVTIEAGTGVGLMFLQDFNLNAPPAIDPNLTSSSLLNNTTGRAVNVSPDAAASLRTQQAANVGVGPTRSR